MEGGINTHIKQVQKQRFTVFSTHSCSKSRLESLLLKFVQSVVLHSLFSMRLSSFQLLLFHIGWCRKVWGLVVDFIKVGNGRRLLKWEEGKNRGNLRWKIPKCGSSHYNFNPFTGRLLYNHYTETTRKPPMPTTTKVFLKRWEIISSLILK